MYDVIDVAMHPVPSILPHSANAFSNAVKRSPQTAVLSGGRQHHVSRNGASAVIAPHALPLVTYAKHRQRPGSVEADVVSLTLLREDISASVRAQHALIQEEQRHRREFIDFVDDVVKRWSKDVEKDLVYVRYAEAQHAKVRMQQDATEKVHQLFTASLAQQKVEAQKKRDMQLEQKRLHAAATRQQFHVASNDAHVRKQLKQQQRRYDAVQHAREAEHNSKYARQFEQQLSVAQRAEKVREDVVTLRRQRIVERALDIHRKKKLVADVRAQSVSPTVFLKLPPLSSVFADDSLSFEPHTLLTRNYHSTYRSMTSMEHHVGERGSGVASTDVAVGTE